MGDGYDVLIKTMKKCGGQVRFELSKDLPPFGAEVIERDFRTVVLVGQRLWDYTESVEAFTRSSWEKWIGADLDEEAE
jgi:hypothetical protein